MVNGLIYEDDTQDRVIHLLYTTGFRLTGDYRSAAALVREALNCESDGGNTEPAAAMMSLCRVFIANGAATFGKSRHTGGGYHNCPDRNSGRVQEALLKLEPVERAAILLRDGMGLSYAEIAAATFSSENEVADRIASGRWALRKMLAPAAV